MVDAGRTTAELGVGKGPAFGDRHRSEIAPVGQVADRPDPRRAGATVDVHRHGAARIGRHACGLEAQSGAVGLAARGVEHGGGGQHRPVGAVELEAPGYLPQRVEADSGRDLDAARGQHRGQTLAQVVIEAPQRQIATKGERDPDPESGHDAGELHRDEAPADHEQRARQLGQVEQVIGGHRVSQPGERIGGRPPAGGQQDARCAMDLPCTRATPVRVRHHHLTRPRQPRPAAAPLDTRARQQVPVDAFEPVDLGALGASPGRHVEAPASGLPPTIAARLVEGLPEAGGIHHQFLGHATADHAGAADAIALDDQHPGAMGGGPAGSGHAARARADHDQIEVVIGAAHLPSLAGPAGCAFRPGRRPGAGGGNRTRTPSRAPDFESGASTSSTTPARMRGNHLPRGGPALSAIPRAPANCADPGCKPRRGVNRNAHRP